MAIKPPASKGSIRASGLASNVEEKNFLEESSTPVLTTDVINLLEEPAASEAREKIVTIRIKPSTYKKLLSLQKAQVERASDLYGKPPKVSESKIISDILDRVL